MGRSLLGMFRKSRTSIGIDLGGRQIKIAVLEMGATGAVVQELIRVELPENVIQGGRIPDADAVSVRLREALHGRNFKNVPIVTGTGSNDCMIKATSLPRAPFKVALEKLPRDESVKPTGGADVTKYGLVILDPTQDGPTMQALVVHARRDSLVRRQQIFYDALVPLSIVDVDAIALANTFQTCHPDLQDAPCVLLHLGYDTSIIVVFDRGHPTLARPLSFGLHKLQREIERSGALGSEDAEALLRSGEFSAMHSKIYNKWLEDAAKQVQQSANYAAKGGDRRPVFLSGGGAIIPGLAQSLGEALSTTIQIFNPLDHLTLGESIGVEQVEQGPLFSIALGFALRGGV